MQVTVGTTQLADTLRKRVPEAAYPDQLELVAVATAAAAGRALEHARSGKGPVFLHLDTVRFSGHYIGDPQVYRDRDEAKELRATRDPIDLATPRTTCGKCHNGQPDARVGQQVIAGDKPNCTSCHVQHVKDKRHWNPQLLSVRAGDGPIDSLFH